MYKLNPFAYVQRKWDKMSGWDQLWTIVLVVAIALVALDGLILFCGYFVATLAGSLIIKFVATASFPMQVLFSIVAAMFLVVRSLFND